jgi:hypothetical protein
MVPPSVWLLWVVLILTIVTLFVLIFVWLPNSGTSNPFSPTSSYSSYSSYSSSSSVTGLTGMGFDDFAAFRSQNVGAIAAVPAPAAAPVATTQSVGFVGESVGNITGPLNAIDSILVPANQVLAGGVSYKVDTGEVTAPAQGFYQITANISSSNAGYTASDLPSINMGYRINQTGPNGGYFRVPAGQQLLAPNSRYSSSFSTVIFLNENDTVTLAVSNGSTMAMTYAEAHLALVRLP